MDTTEQTSPLLGIPAAHLWERIERINAELAQGEPGNISSDNRGYTGYDPQAIYDAVNRHLGPENWTYSVISVTAIQEKQFEAQVSIAILVGGEWLTKGIQFGGGRGDRDLTDGKKAAITDGLKKAFSAWSIGNRAFLGLLDPKKPAPKAATQRPAQPVKPATPAPSSDRPPLSAEQVQLLNVRVKAIRETHGKTALTKEAFTKLLQDTFGEAVTSFLQLSANDFTAALDMLGNLDEALTAKGAA